MASKEPGKRDGWKKAGLIGVGTVLGVLLSLNFSAIAQREAKTPIPYEDLQLLSAVFGKIKSDYVETVADDKLIKEAINGMVHGLDPHSDFLDAEAFKELQVSTQGKFGGLGIEVGVEDGIVRVTSPIEDTPAFRAGIKAGDLIVKIDDTATRGLPLSKAVEKMRGKPGTQVVLTVVRKEVDQPLSFTLTREEINVKSVRAKMLEPGYGYVRLRSFQERTAEDLHEQLEKLVAQNGKPLEGLVLDLRDNPGGLLDQAVRVADEWLADGLIVYTKGRVAAQRQEFRAAPDGESSYPIVALVNAGSASASEIVAGALQDQHRALVLGTTTFGKGSEQTVFPLQEGSGLRLTTALYYTPSGRSIQEVGIAPDIEFGQPTELPAPPGETEAERRIREQDLEGHFTQGRATGEGAAAAAEKPGEPHDAQLERAREVLKSWTYFDRFRAPAEAPSQTAGASGPAAP